MNNKVKNILIILVVTLLVIVTVILINNLSNKEESNINETNNENIEETEAEITDNDVIMELDKKINIILTGDIGDYSNKNITITPFDLYESIFSNNMSSSEKLHRVLTSIDNDEIEEVKIDINDIEVDIPVEQIDIPFLTGEISADKVQQQAKLIFGEELPNQTTDTTKCPRYICDIKNNKYYVQGGCGGMSPNKVEVYKNKYTIKGDTAYVYVNVAELSNEYSNSTVAAHIFKDYVGTANKKYEDVKDYVYKELTSYESNSNIINESNYKEFEEYIFKFKKDSNGNYYFVELLK